MNVLLAGGHSYLMDAMIDKLNKEGHRIFVLSGNRYNAVRFKKVFEQYDFDYASDSIREVVESVQPDACVFFGAHDTNFGGDAGQRDSVVYTSGLINLLMALSTIGKQVRFIYLSHESIFNTTHDQDITEDASVKPQGDWETAVRQGEMTCCDYQASTGVDTIVARLDHLYGRPDSIKDMPDFMKSLCTQGFSGGMIQSNGKRRLSLLHVKDAVQFIYTLLTAEEHKEKLYNISSSNPLSELDIARAFAEGFFGTSEGKVDAANIGQKYRVVLSNERYFEEFGGRIFDIPETSLKEIASYIKRHQKQYEAEGSRSSVDDFWGKLKELFWLLVPYLETAVAFIPFFMLNNRATDSEYFANLDFYLLYVLVFAIAFGQQQATFAGVLATIGYIFRQQYNRSSFDVIVDYNTYVWIAQIFILGLVVGHLKDRLSDMRGENEKEVEYLEGQLSDISDINSANVHIKGVLETQIINQNDSFGKVYEITSTLDQYEPEEVLFYAAEVVAKLNHSDDVAIYSVSNRDYARLFASTSAQARVFGNSMKYRELTDMYEEISKDHVYINKNMDDRYPLMANAIFSEDEMDLIIMIWGIPWDRMNLSQANMLRITGYLIQNAVIRANRYMQALENERYKGGSSVLETAAFTTLLRAYTNAMNKNLTEACVLRVDIGDNSVTDAGDDIVKVIRNSDYMGTLTDGNFYVLLSNTSPDNASFVINRFKEIGYPAVIQEGVAL